MICYHLEQELFCMRGDPLHPLPKVAKSLFPQPSRFHLPITELSHFRLLMQPTTPMALGAFEPKKAVPPHSSNKNQRQNNMKQANHRNGKKAAGKTVPKGRRRNVKKNGTTQKAHKSNALKKKAKVSK